MASPIFWIKCETLENEYYDFCIFTLDESILPGISKPEEILEMIDKILPTMRSDLEKVPFKNKGFLVYNSKNKKGQQK